LVNSYESTGYPVNKKDVTYEGACKYIQPYRVQHNPPFGADENYDNRPLQEKRSKEIQFLEGKMKGKIIYIFWAIVFFLVGVGLLAGYIDIKQLSQQVKLLSLTVASIAFIVSYFMDGIRKWGWLLPAFVCAALAVDIGLELNGIYNSQLKGVPY
jgi:cytochrome c oxidase subunit IV